MSEKNLTQNESKIPAGAILIKTSVADNDGTSYDITANGLAAIKTNSETPQVDPAMISTAKTLIPFENSSDNKNVHVLNGLETRGDYETVREGIENAENGNTVKIGATMPLGNSVGFGGACLIENKAITLDCNANRISGTGETLTLGESATLAINGDGTIEGVRIANNGTIIHSALSNMWKVTFAGNKTDENGAAISNLNHLEMTNATFRNNETRWDGGAVHNTGTYTAKGNAFTQNVAKRFGGGIFNSGTLNAGTSSFTGNTAAYGGAIYNTGTVNAQQNTLEGNSAKSFGGAISNCGTLDSSENAYRANTASRGAAIANIGKIESAKDTFSANNAEKGGAIYNEGPGIIELKDATFTGNTAAEGGAIWNEGTIILKGKIKLEKETDTFFNESGGTVDWDITAGPEGEYGQVNNYSLMTNNGGSFTITVNGEEQETGKYTLAKKAEKELSDSKKTFTIMGTGKEQGTAITIDGKEIATEHRLYKLSREADDIILSIKEITLYDTIYIGSEVNDETTGTIEVGGQEFTVGEDAFAKGANVPFYQTPVTKVLLISDNVTAGTDAENMIERSVLRVESGTAKAGDYNKIDKTIKLACDNTGTSELKIAENVTLEGESPKNGNDLTTGGKLFIQNDGHLDIKAHADQEITIRNTSTNTLTGEYSGKKVTIQNTGSVKDATIQSEKAVEISGTGNATGMIIDAENLFMGGASVEITGGEILDQTGVIFLAYASQQDLTDKKATGGAVLTITGNVVIDGEIRAGDSAGNLFGRFKMNGTQAYDNFISARDIDVLETSDVMVKGASFDFKNLNVNGKISVNLNNLDSLTMTGDVKGNGTLNITSDSWTVNDTVHRNFADFEGTVTMKDGIGSAAITMGQGGATEKSADKGSYFGDRTTMIVTEGQEINLNGKSVATGITFKGSGALNVFENQTLTADNSSFTGTAHVTEGRTLTIQNDFGGNVNLDKDEDTAVTTLILDGENLIFRGTVKGDTSTATEDILSITGNATLSAKGALNDFAGKIILGDKTLTLEGENETSAKVTGDDSAKIIAKTDQIFSGDLSGYTGLLEFTGDNIITLAGTIATSLNVDGNELVLSDSLTNEETIEVNAKTNLKALNANKNSVKLLAGTISKATSTSGSIDLSEYENGAIDILTSTAGEILLTSDQDITVQTALDGNLTFTVTSEQETASVADLVFNGASLTYEDTITVKADEDLFANGYKILTASNGLAMPEGWELNLEIAGQTGKIEINKETRLGNKIFTLKIEGGKTLVMQSRPDSTDKVFVNENWTEALYTQVIDNFYSPEKSVTRSIGYDAAKSIDDAIQYIKADKEGRGTIELTENKSYGITKELGTSGENGNNVTTMTLQSRPDNPTKTANATVTGVINAGAATTLNLSHISAKGSIYGAGTINVTNTGINRSSGTYIATSGTLNITGGVYTTIFIAGGTYNTTPSTATSVILTGTADRTSFASTIYGGSIADGVAVTQSDAASVTVDATSKIYISGSIYAAGLGINGGQLTMSGDRTVTFTGTGTNLSFTGRVSGNAQGTTATVSDGTANLVFNSFTGKFNGSIADFHAVTFKGANAIEFGRRQTLTSSTDTVFCVTDSTIADTAMYTVRDKNMWEFGNKITVNVENGTASGTYKLIGNYAAGFDKITFCVAGNENVSIGTEVKDAMGNSYILKYESSTLSIEFKRQALQTRVGSVTKANQGKTVDVYDFDGLKNSSGAVGVSRENMTENATIAFEQQQITLNEIVQVIGQDTESAADDIWAKATVIGGKTYLLWAQTEKESDFGKVMSALENAEIAFGQAIVSTDGVNFEKMSNEMFNKWLQANKLA